MTNSLSSRDAANVCWREVQPHTTLSVLFISLVLSHLSVNTWYKHNNNVWKQNSPWWSICVSIWLLTSVYQPSSAVLSAYRYPDLNRKSYRVDVLELHSDNGALSTPQPWICACILLDLIKLFLWPAEITFTRKCALVFVFGRDALVASQLSTSLLNSIEILVTNKTV